MICKKSCSLEFNSAVCTVCSGVPDWGEDDDCKGNPKKSDTEIARELQNMFNSELQGPGHISLDDSDEMLAKKLQVRSLHSYFLHHSLRGLSSISLISGGCK